MSRIFHHFLIFTWVLCSMLSLHAASNVVAQEPGTFVTNLVTAYNTRDLKALEGLIGSPDQRWLLKEARRGRDQLQMRILDVSVSTGQVVVTVDALAKRLDDGAGRSHKMILTLVRQGPSFKLVNTRTPDVDSRNQEFREAKVAALRLVAALNAQDTNAVLRLLGVPESGLAQCDVPMLCRTKRLDWVDETLARQAKADLAGIVRHRNGLVVSFSVSGGRSETNRIELVSFGAKNFDHGCDAAELRRADSGAKECDTGKKAGEPHAY